MYLVHDRSDLIIKNIGQSLYHIMPELLGQNISQAFDLTRPLIEFKFVSVSFVFVVIFMNI